MDAYELMAQDLELAQTKRRSAKNLQQKLDFYGGVEAEIWATIEEMRRKSRTYLPTH